MLEPLPALRLKRHEDRRLRAGHLWVFSNEIDVQATPLSGFEPGTLVEVQAQDGRPLGVATLNPQALICARLLDRDRAVRPDAAWFAARIARALAWRQRCGLGDHGRIVFGESDGLPGLVVDRFGPTLVAQSATLGMDRLRPAIDAALAAVLAPKTLYWKNDASARELEGLPKYTETVGAPPVEPLPVFEAGLAMAALPVSGQKTGWFYDQAANRDRLVPWLSGVRVLDVFSYVGAWSLRALAAGAREAWAIDASARALEVFREQAAAHGWADRTQALHGDAFQRLAELAASGERFDVVIVDPPAFAKRKRDLPKAAQAYRKLFEAAMRVCTDEGLLVACSCSWHYPRTALVEGIQQAAARSGRAARLVAMLGQGPDHPVHPAIPETDYLKGAIVRVHRESSR